MLLALSVLTIAEPLITCEPRELRGVPGEPLQTLVTVETDRAAPIQLKIPAASNLFLRTVEKVPIQRTNEGRYLHQRLIIWQGLDAANISLTNLTVVFQGLEKKVPNIGILIEDVKPAAPPQKPEVTE